VKRLTYSWRSSPQRLVAPTHTSVGHLNVHDERQFDRLFVVRVIARQLDQALQGLHGLPVATGIRNASSFSLSASSAMLRPETPAKLRNCRRDIFDRRPCAHDLPHYNTCLEQETLASVKSFLIASVGRDLLSFPFLRPRLRRPEILLGYLQFPHENAYSIPNMAQSDLQFLISRLSNPYPHSLSLRPSTALPEDGNGLQTSTSLEQTL
jgi:hypothetical protein